jgi:hypothetical protein
VLKRSEHITEWIRLTEEKNKSASCVDIPKGRGQPKGGIRAAVRDLGIDLTARESPCSQQTKCHPRNSASDLLLSR